MVNFIAIFIVSFLVLVVGSGLGYVIWLKTRPKKETWSAKVYQLGDGVRTSPQSKLQVNDLKPYAMDVLERIDKAPGIVIYRLQKLNKVTPPVEGDVVEYWGKDKRVVSVLLNKGSCSLLKSGYDKITGEAVFDPLTSSKVHLIKSEIAIQKERLQKEKDILQAITPWIVAGITIIGLIAIAYTMVSGFVEMSENFDEGMEKYAKLTNQAQDERDRIDTLKQGVQAEQRDLGAQSPQDILLNLTTS